MRFIIERVLLALLCGAWLAGPALAEKADREQPVHIEADAVHMDDARKTAQYEGHVILTQGTMSMLADRIDVSQDAQGMDSGVATGKPVHFKQKMDGRDEFMEADALRVEYDARTELVKLIGSAHLKQGGDDLRGALITYDMNTERYQAQGSDSGSPAGRVHAVILPRNKGSAGSTKP
ncbi:MAG: lipopolysaccharide transport periplasmic protein LptA [Parasulfuritortus sp.]|jgi:lipopolysaccharide export system protein LptA|nr:lipopolysaccharide transport periplasmic protein LptA [Parasulfuritortus sp.]